MTLSILYINKIKIDYNINSFYQYIYYKLYLFNLLYIMFKKNLFAVFAILSCFTKIASNANEKTFTAYGDKITINTEISGNKIVNSVFDVKEDKFVFINSVQNGKMNGNFMYRIDELVKIIAPESSAKLSKITDVYHFAIGEMENNKIRFIDIHNKYGDLVIKQYRVSTLNSRVVRYYPDGNVYSSFDFKNDNKHGKYYKYHDNGSVQYIADFKKGKIDGKIYEFHKNSQLKNLTLCKKGTKKSILKSYNDKGEPIDLTEENLCDASFAEADFILIANN